VSSLVPLGRSGRGGRRQRRRRAALRLPLQDPVERLRQPEVFSMSALPGWILLVPLIVLGGGCSSATTQFFIDLSSCRPAVSVAGITVTIMTGAGASASQTFVVNQLPDSVNVSLVASGGVNVE